MKKYLITFAACSVLLFAACKKEENKGYTINGDKITFGVGITNPENTDKQVFNGSSFIQYAIGDSMFVNGIEYRVNPCTSNGTVDVDTSRYAHVTAQVASNGEYSFVYPSAIFTNTGNSYTATFPADVQCINYNGIRFDISDPHSLVPGPITELPIWPMYRHININETPGAVIPLYNACAFLSPTFRYGPAFAQAVLHPFTGATYVSETGGSVANCPVLHGMDGAIKTSFRTTGGAHLDITNVEAPKMVMDSMVGTHGYDIVHYGFPANTRVTFDNGNAKNGGLVPIAPVANATHQIQLLSLFYVDVWIGTTPTRLYMAVLTNSKTWTGELPRNTVNSLQVEMFNIGGDPINPNYDYIDGTTAENYVSRALADPRSTTMSYSAIQFENMRVYITANTRLGQVMFNTFGNSPFGMPTALQN